MTINFSGGPTVSTWGTNEKGEQVWRARLADGVGYFSTPTANARTSVLQKLALRALADSIG